MQRAVVAKGVYMKKKRTRVLLLIVIALVTSCQSSLSMKRDEFKKATIAVIEDNSYTAEDKAFIDALDTEFYREVLDNGAQSAKLIVKYIADKDDGSSFNREAFLSYDGETVPLQVSNVESEITLKIDGNKKNAKIETGHTINLTGEISLSPAHVQRLVTAQAVGLRLYVGPRKKPVTVNYAPKIIALIQQWAAIGRQ